jgi:hypothetical protein
MLQMEIKMDLLRGQPRAVRYVSPTQLKDRGDVNVTSGQCCGTPQAMRTDGYVTTIER